MLMHRNRNSRADSFLRSDMKDRLQDWPETGEEKFKQRVDDAEKGSKVA